MKNTMTLALAAFAASAFATPTAQIRVDGANNGKNDIFLDSITYSNSEIYTDFIGASAIRSFQTGGGHAKTDHRVVAGPNSKTVADKTLVLDNGNGPRTGDEVSESIFRANALTAINSRNLNHFYDINNGDAHFQMTLDYSQDPLRHKLFFFERGPGGPNSVVKLEAVDKNGNRIGNAVVVNPSMRKQTNIDAVTWNRGESLTHSGTQDLGYYDLDISDFGVNSMSYLRISTPGTFGFRGADNAPDFTILASAAPVPEPGTMLAIGAGAALLARRRKAKKA